MKPSAIILFFLVTMTVILISNSVDARKCRKGVSKEEGKKCSKSKRGKDKSGRARNKHGRKPVAPYWRKGPPKSSETIVREGTRITLACAIKGTPSPKFTWLRNGKELTPKALQKIRIRRHRLTIPTVIINDMGSYTCIARNNLGSLNFTYSLRILENIRFKSIEVVDRPENQTAQVGDTAIFLCRSEDWPKPRVHWTKQTKTSHVIEAITSTKQGDHSVLVLHNVTKADSGTYTCFIGNNKTHKQLSATLTVIDEGEVLPFEPKCSLHVRRQTLVDHKLGCKSSEPVDIHYCMGSCGRSYYVPQMMTEDSTENSHLNQTCSCCIGVVESLRIVELECSLGQKKRGFYTLLRGCQCQACTVKDEHSTVDSISTTSSP